MIIDKRKGFGILCAIFVIISHAYVFASSKSHEDHDQQDIKEAIQIIEQDTAQPATGIVEHLGDYIPLDLEFTSSQGEKVTLGSVINRPTLLLPVYFSCSAACPLLLADLASAINSVSALPGKDYQVIAFSFDHNDSPDYARQAKKNYLKILDGDFPENSWTFLTGSKENIEQLTNAVGFYFKEIKARQFTHPSLLLCLAEDGQIIRYIYGPGFLPLDLSMAISEAAKGTPAISIKKLINFCFSYDPKGKKYVFNTFRVVGISCFLTLAGFYFFVLRKGNK